MTFYEFYENLNSDGKKIVDYFVKEVEKNFEKGKFEKFFEMMNEENQKEYMLSVHRAAENFK